MTVSRINLRGSERLPYPKAVVSDHARAEELITISLCLRPAQPLPAVSENSRPLDQEEYTRLYGASPQDMQKVLQFAKDNELPVLDYSFAKRTVTLSAKVFQAEEVFDTSLQEVQHPTKGTFRVREGHISIPKNLDGIIEGVFGLDNRPCARPYFRKQAETTWPFMPAASSTSYTAPQVAKAYNFPTSVNGQGQTIGIISLGGGIRAADLQSYFKSLSLPVPTIKYVNVDGATNTPGSDADVENCLDVMVTGAVAPGATIVVFVAPNTDAGFLDAILTATHYGVNVISISWGAPEDQWSQQSIQAFDQAFQAASLLGISVCVASGDNGSSDGEVGDHADFPASSPHVVACGGTRLASGLETVWNDGVNGGATGGGYSATFAQPSWQSGIPTGPKGSARGVPDVAGNASPTTGYQIVCNGQRMVIGGTSAVAPLYAGLIALWNQALGKPAGPLPQALYTLPSNVYRDITQGSNGTFSAAVGWDPCTGLGAIDGSKALNALGAVMPAPPPPVPVPTPVSGSVNTYALRIDWANKSVAWQLLN